MQILLLFLIGGSLGYMTSVAARVRRQRQIFFNVSLGLIGAGFGGITLTRAFNRAGTSTGAVDIRSLALGALTAGIFVGAVAVLRRLWP